MDLAKFLDDFSARIAAERDALKQVRALDGPDLEDVAFRKYSHNAVIFSASVNGRRVWLKKYLTETGPTLVARSVEESRFVNAEIDKQIGGVVEILWADERTGIVLMEDAPGEPVSRALEAGSEDVIPAVARWFSAYVGDRTRYDEYSPGYWVRQRRAAGCVKMDQHSQALFEEALARQEDRKNGPMPALKGEVPSDFAPHNLHWDGTKIWGFDIEGSKEMPLAKAIASFAVLAARRWPEGTEGDLGVDPCLIEPFYQVLDLGQDDPALLRFLMLDALIESLQRRHDDPVKGPRIRRAISRHLSAVD